METIAVIGVCTLVFAGITQTASSALTNQTSTVAALNAQNYSGSTQNIPDGYVKADYKVELGQYSKQATAKDISKEGAAEIGARNLWKLFGLDLSGQTIEMTYNPATSTNLRADWAGMVTINKNHFYAFDIDAVTGECRTACQEKYWDEKVDTSMDKYLIENHAEFDSLAKAIAEKYQLVPGKVASVEYYGQGYSSGPSGGQNSQIDMRVISENGQQAQLTFSRHNKEFLGVAYDCWIKDAAQWEEQILKKQKEAEDKGTHIEIHDKDTGNGTGFWLKVVEEGK